MVREARPDESVRTEIVTKIFFLSGRPQKKIVVPARTGSDGDSPPPCRRGLGRAIIFSKKFSLIYIPFTLNRDVSG